MDTDFPLTDTQQTVINNFGQSQLSLQEPAEEKPLSLQEDGSIAPPSPKLAQVRAAKVAYSTKQDQDVTAAGIASGREPQVRQQVALDSDLDWQQTRNNLIRKIIVDNEGKVTPDQLSVLQEMSKEDWIHDPNTVFEKKFAQKFVRDQVAENVAQAPNSMWSKAWKENPVATAQNIRIFSDIQTKNEIAKTIAEDAEDEAKQRGVLQTIGGYIWGATPGVAWWNQSRILKEAPWDGLNLPGKIKREQISYLLRLPPEEMQAKAKQAYEQLKEVSFQQAQEFAHALVKYSTNDEYLMSGSGILDLSLLPWGRIASRVGNLGGNFAGRVAESMAVPPKPPSPMTFIGGKETYAVSPARATNAVTEGSIYEKLPPINEVVQDVAKQSEYTIQPNLFKHLEDQRPSNVRANSDAGKPEGFRTARGSTYNINPDGTTTRTVAGDATHEAGLKSPSKQTVYIAEENVNKALRSGGNIEGIPYKTNPEIGLTPVEFFDGKYHVGSPITSLTTKPEKQFLSSMEPGQMRATYKPLAQQDAEAEAASQRTGRNVSGRFEKGQGQYYQEEFEAGQPGVRAGFDKNSFKTQDEIYLTKDGSIMDARTGQRLSSNRESEMFKLKMDEGIDRQVAFAGRSKGISKLTDDIMNGGGTRVPGVPSDAPSGLYGTMERNTPRWEDAPIKPTDMAPSYVNPKNYFGNGNALYGPRAMAVAEAEARDRQWQAVLDNTIRVQRVPSEVAKQAYEEAKAKLLLNNSPRFGDGVLDVVHLAGELFKSNVGQAVMRIGDNRTKLPFATKGQAELFADKVYHLAPDEFRIYVDPKKGDYYIGLRANIAENSDNTLNIFATLKNAYKGGDSIVSTLASIATKARMNDAWIPSEVMASRKVAEHAQQNLKEFAIDQIKFFRQMGPEKAKEVERVINDFGAKRQWFDTAEQFSEGFQRRFGRPPTESQIEGAYLYKQLNDYDFMIRNAGMYRDMARQGAERHALMLPDGTSEHFNGIQLDKLPWGKTEDFTIALYKAGDKEAKVNFAHTADRGQGQLTKKELDNLITEKGYRIVQVFDPSERPLQKMGLHDSYVNYVVTDAVDTKPLAWQQLKYEPGPHSIYPYEYYLKQPKLAVGHLGRLYYYGDNTLANFSSKAEADMWLERYNTARQMVKDGDKGAEAYITKNLPYSSMKEFNQLRNIFDMETPFAVTQRGYSVFETQDGLAKAYPDAINFHKSTHNPQNFMDRTFLQERDQLLNNPVERNNIIRFEPAKQLDAFEALDRGLSQSIRGLWLNDEKVGAITRWIENYHDVLSISHQKARDIPLWALQNAPFANIAKGSPLYEKLIAAKEERQAIINFLGQQSDWGNAVGRLQGRVMDTIYNNLGKDATDFTANHSLSFLKDPTRFFRAMAAHPTIGMFNPIPMIQQALTHFNVMAIAPEHAIRSSAAAFLLEATAHTGEEAIINRAAKIASNFGWKENNFKELMEIYRNSGLDIVGKEASMSAANFDGNLFRSLTGQVFRDKGFMFFNAGERFTRRSAIGAAYSEARAVKPVGKFSETEIANIMQRADTMTGHMTSASLSNLQQGEGLVSALTSVAGQFSTYYLHMAQLMMGKELTVGEKARLFGVNSIMFGVPAGLGIGGVTGGVGSALTSFLDVTNTPKDNFLGGLDKVPKALVAGASGTLGLWNMYDDIMQWAKSNNIPINNSFAQGMLKGVPNLMFQLITGKDPDIAKNYGLGANGMLRDIYMKDKPFLDVLSGASGSVIGDIIHGMEPAIRKAWGSVSSDSNSDLGPFQASDALRIARVVKSLDWIDRVYMAYNYGRWESKQGVRATGLDGMDTLLTALRLTPDDVQKAFLENNVGQAQKSIQDKYEKLYIESMRRSYNAEQEGDAAKAMEYRRDARAYVDMGDFGLSDRTRLFHRAIQESFGFTNNAQKRFEKKAPESLTIERALPQHFRMKP